MRLLLHICCAPCATYPVSLLHQEGRDVSGFFHNPNIHPYQEFRKRVGAVRQFAELTRLKVIYRDNYDLEEFLRQVVFREEERCRICYFLRLKATAEIAASEQFDSFSTTLLYSKYQKHELIKDLGESLAREYKLSFYYEDFRKGWKQGITMSKDMELYRQQYCGCIYSEKERFCKD